MDAPGYLDYGKMYEMNPGAFWQSQSQADLALQFEQQKRIEAAAQAKATLETSNLANMFSERSLEDRLRQTALNADTTAAELEPKRTAAEVSVATRPQQIDQAKRDLALKASQFDLDALDQRAQLMMYSSNPQLQQEGLRLKRLHKDYVKMREESRLKQQEQGSLEAQRHGGAMALERLQQEGGKYKRGQAGWGLSFKQKLESMKVPERMGVLNAVLETGKIPGTDEDLSDIEKMYFQSMLNQDKATYGAKLQQQGVTAGVSPSGQVTIVPKQSPSLEAGSRQQTPQPPTQTGASLADVQKMYPGVPADKLKQAYKAKFGVDLQ